MKQKKYRKNDLLINVESGVVGYFLRYEHDPPCGRENEMIVVKLRFLDNHYCRAVASSWVPYTDGLDSGKNIIIEPLEELRKWREMINR